MQKTNPLLILDDSKARRIAAKLNLQFTGTLGILLKAKQAGNSGIETNIGKNTTNKFPVYRESIY